MPTNQSNSPKKSPLTNYARYSTMAFQMLATIGVGVWGGIKLDEYFEMKFPLFTIVLSLAAVAGGIYWAIRDLLKKQ